MVFNSTKLTKAYFENEVASLLLTFVPKPFVNYSSAYHEKVWENKQKEINQVLPNLFSLVKNLFKSDSKIKFFKKEVDVNTYDKFFEKLPLLYKWCIEIKLKEYYLNDIQPFIENLLNVGFFNNHNIVYINHAREVIKVTSNKLNNDYYQLLNVKLADEQKALSDIIPRIMELNDNPLTYKDDNNTFKYSDSQGANKQVKKILVTILQYLNIHQKTYENTEIDAMSLSCAKKLEKNRTRKPT